MQSFRVVDSSQVYKVPIAAYPIQEKFALLEQLLASKHWQKANQETFAILSAICGLTGDRTVKIGNLSYYDLHVIDSLWLKYSHGRFGFSVQQRIWYQCGAAIEVQDSQDRRWITFCDRVGWNIKPDKTPAGYFPSQVAVSQRTIDFPEVFTRLYSSLAVCRLSIYQP